MKYVRITATPNLEATPQIFQLLAASPHVTEARLLGWNFANPEAITMLFSVLGDYETFSTALVDIPELVDVDLTPTDERRFYLLATIRPPFFKDLFEKFMKYGLLVIIPVLYRDGNVHARFVSKTEIIQAALDDIPSEINVTIHEIGEKGFEHESVAGTLSKRQQETVQAAIELGYYEMPRRVTYEDIADRLGCASSTASEHLQKAEAKIVRATMTEAAFSGTSSWLPSNQS